MTVKEPSFSIFEFKYWLSKQPDFKCVTERCSAASEMLNELVDTTVESRLGNQRLEHQIEKHNPDMAKAEIKRAARLFKNEGGVVKEIHNLNLLIEVASITFSLPKIYTKLK